MLIETQQTVAQASANSRRSGIRPLEQRTEHRNEGIPRGLEMHGSHHHLRIIFLALACGSIAAGQPTGRFTATGSMTRPRLGHTATLLADGTVLIAGGYNSTGNVYGAETYDPKTGAFTPAGRMLNDYTSTSTLLADSNVLLVGAIAQIYDPSTRTFAATGNGATGYGCSATLLNNGKVLLIDNPPPYGPSATAELYDSETGSFAPTGPYASIEIAQMDHAADPGYGGWDCRRAILLANGTVLVAGGVAAEIYDPQTNSFSLTGAITTTASGFVTTLPLWGDPAVATLLLNGSVLFSGGDQDLGPSREAWLYDPSPGIFRTTGAMMSARSSNPTTLLPDGTVLITGGEGLSPAGPRAIDDAELYSAVAATFSSAGEMTSPRWGHTSTLLADGRVLIAGGVTGVNDSEYLYSAEIYTPAVAIPAPVLFPLSTDGSGQGAIWHAATGLAASQGSPATAGEILSMYTENLADTGVIPPRVAVGGRFAEVLYFGPAPGYPGYFQINFRMPDGVAPGPATPVRVTYLDRPSNEVGMAVQ
jgi:Galactose oxidase, central domain